VTLASMTGFARAEGHLDGLAWTWEVKSVNNKGLDLRCRLAPGFDALESTVRNRTAATLKRGSVSINLAVTRAVRDVRYAVNRTALAQIAEIARDVARELDAAPPRLDGLLALRGILEPVEEDEDEGRRTAREAAVAANFDVALNSLAAIRAEEGARLAEILNTQLDELRDLCRQATATATMQPAALRERLSNQVAALLDGVSPLSEERLVQEVALLVAKADVREELDRFRAHLEACAELVTAGGPVGRRLDFLCQELNREANTLCSKSSDIGLTNVGLSMKAVVEQFREQVQNVE